MIRYIVHLSVIDSTKYDIEINCNGQYLFFPEQIASFFDIDLDNYLLEGKKYNAIVGYNEYVNMQTMLFTNKKDAKKFIEEYFINRLIPIYQISKM